MYLPTGIQFIPEHLFPLLINARCDLAGLGLPAGCSVRILMCLSFFKSPPLSCRAMLTSSPRYRIWERIFISGEEGQMSKCSQWMVQSFFTCSVGPDAFMGQREPSNGNTDRLLPFPGAGL